MIRDFYIPVEDNVRAFKCHLECHPRTILSAKFGDGKSYFLNKFCEDEVVLQEYEFITIYPVNYQVLDNADVFDILKRDIILQMGAKGMVSESDSIVSEEMALLYCIKNKGLTLFEALLDVAANSPTSNISMLGKFCKSAMKLLETFNNAKKEYDKVKTSDIDKLIEKVSNAPIDEEDLYSRIIKRNLNEWRCANGKKVALIIEDMDRLDPAHIFRILNVLSAQLDSCYYSGVGSDVYSKNKLGFDNVVLVLHHNNLHNIYKHVYGDKVDFEGYISKFVSSGIFKYSLQRERINHFYEVIEKGIGLPRSFVEKLISTDNFNGISLRKVAKSLESPEKQLEGVAKNLRIMKLLVVIYRLMETQDVLINRMSDMLSMEYTNLIEELYPCFKDLCLLENNQLVIETSGKYTQYSFFQNRLYNPCYIIGFVGKSYTARDVATQLMQYIYK